MKKIINPEKECPKTPKRFSGESRIVSVDKEEYNSGIILDSPEEFVDALRVYGGALVIDGSRATQENLNEAVGNKDGILGISLLERAGAINAGPDALGFTFVDRLSQMALSEMKSRGSFNRHFDYDAMGTNFFKTTVEGEKVGGKYLLKLCAAYVGTEPEVGLAKTLGKPRALVRATAEGRLNVVDDWWFNVNLEDAMKNLPIFGKRKVESWAQHITSGGSRGEVPEFEFEHNRRKFALRVGLSVNSYLRPENGEYEDRYIQAKGKSIVGGAWTHYSDNHKTDPQAVQPSLVCSVSFPGKSYSKPPAVTPEEMKAVREARDYIAEKLSQK